MEWAATTPQDGEQSPFERRPQPVPVRNQIYLEIYGYFVM